MRFAALFLVAAVLAACLVSTWAEPASGGKKPSSPKNIPKPGGSHLRPAQFSIPKHSPPKGGSSSPPKKTNPQEPKKIIHGFEVKKTNPNEPKKIIHGFEVKKGSGSGGK